MHVTCTESAPHVPSSSQNHPEMEMMLVSVDHGRWRCVRVPCYSIIDLDRLGSSWRQWQGHGDQIWFGQTRYKLLYHSCAHYGRVEAGGASDACMG
ncbi:hypothetical protein HBI56_120000 [Parastagonospora nodorum]|uniref:Uncharacterized protein n=1 Tax=Phaeosphaeria nodorum (strain SN15 / ATCC MYA-4574 / FGSC 10173) TaxID=321614 RepID=A0A7U2FBS6_PHANO|nr:hypothetical protein HBH56_054760 [Parastagonospora nodorum]QRD02348.1 hypothetical protein JI435_053210 [Parastagonospora nodorum SN15]KAH3935924.1 hypothetical protein HBH54_040560 [Parastagonospora nodorum]KAH3948570.1 hypothetical protein HBH53_098740 [Parastagonospora nodorum]KAH3969952.1 hypothetical protein HBH51_120700 [Parastagonospora nodorum]